MEKKLTRYDILISLSFVFALIVGVGSFFFGLQTGKEQTDLKYQSFMQQLRDESDKESAAYQQQQLVSFYHTILLPFREFQQAWFEQLAGIDSGTEDSETALGQLSRQADETYAEIEPTTIPESSPLLQNAHRNYLKSLKLFHEATKGLQGQTGGVALSADQAGQDAYVLEAYEFALQAQRQYYDAILEWSVSENPAEVQLERLADGQVTLDEWRGWNLNAKNAYIARMLLEDGTLYEFYPQDISSRIDDLDVAGQTVKLKLTTVNQAAQTLLSTGGVRDGDYLRLKDKLYSGEVLPQLPFFAQ